MAAVLYRLRHVKEKISIKKVSLRSGMKKLKTGQFFGNTSRTLQLAGLTITDTEYTHPKVDWHYHENAYFTFILQGNVIEGNRKEVYHCAGGTLLFHNWQEPHYNIKPAGYTRGLHVELNGKWLSDYSLNASCLEGSRKITDVDTRLLFYKVFKETRTGSGEPAIESLVLAAIDSMIQKQKSSSTRRPAWTKKITELLYYEPQERLRLKDIASALNIHPVHLCRDFARHFNCTLGEYQRKLKIQRSLTLLPDDRYTLTEVAHACGFSDQSHFIRSFKRVYGISPNKFRKDVFSR